jgi:glutamyl-tRNA reductase
MGTLAAKRFKLEGAAEISVINRDVERARGVVAQLGTGRAIELPGLTNAMAEVDIVVTSTGASHFIVTPGNVAEAMLRRPERKLMIVDIAVPRDVDPEVRRIPGVDLADIDALHGMVDVSLEKRREAIPLVEEIISEHAERFQQWYQSRVAVPVISSLVQKAEAIREAEIERLFARAPDLTDRQRMLVTGMSLTVISRLLHNAITKIRDKAVANRTEALTLAQIIDDLFDLHVRSQDLEVLHMPEAFDAEYAE